MFALGAQQPGQAVALLLRPAAREDLMQVVVVAAFRPPHLRKVPDHRAHLRLHAVFGIVPAQEADQLPVLVAQFQALGLRLGLLAATLFPLLLLVLLPVLRPKRIADS